MSELPSPRPNRWIWLVAAGFAVRVLAALVVERAARSRGSLCLFDDTKIYWQLARAMRLGLPFEVDQYGIPHRALRTPGYPAFLAISQAIFGADSTLAPRLIQAALGAACVGLIYGLVRSIWPDPKSRSIATWAAVFAAFEPYWVGTSALLLSELVFVFFLLLMLWGVAVLWRSGPIRHPAILAIGAGLAAGCAILVRPSWSLAVPLFLAAWVIAERNAASLRNAAFVALGVAIAMAPWWVRNGQVFGRFVPTALWSGASLYDGISPTADGSSDMRFLGERRFRVLGEIEQDRALSDEATRFAREHPGRVAALAIIKAGRFWCPWPNAESFRSRWGAVASAFITLPTFVLLAVGVWDRKRDVRALVLLGGPLLYFFALHLIFVSSIRYRIPAEVPAFGLMAVGLSVLGDRLSSRKP